MKIFGTRNRFDLTPHLPGRQRTTSAANRVVIAALALAASIMPLYGRFNFTDADWIGLGATAGVNGPVNAILVDTNSSLVYYGGNFSTVGDRASGGFAVWNGTNWLTPGLGAVNTISAMMFDGNGGLLVAGTYPTSPNSSASGILKLDSGGWHVMASVTNGNTGGAVYSLVTDTSGDLYAGGQFTSINGVSAVNIAKWNGTNWAPLLLGANKSVYVLTFDQSGSLYAGGAFTVVDNIAANAIARWDGTNWNQVGYGIFNGTAAAWVNTITFDSTGNLYAGGLFNSAGNALANCIARWDGANWYSIGEGFKTNVQCLVTDGAGNLYAGGDFTVNGVNGINPLPYIAKWDGNAWSSLGSGLSGRAVALAFDGSGTLNVGGAFSVAGNITAANVAAWDGTSWHSRNQAPVHPALDDLATSVAANGSSPMYVAGRFANAGAVSVNGFAAWDGTNWDSLGGGITGTYLANNVTPAVAIAPNGLLYALGNFSGIGGVTATNLASWNGTNWSALGAGLLGGSVPNYNQTAPKAIVADAKNRLIAGGSFTRAGSVYAQNIAGWDGTNWYPLGSGCQGTVSVLAADRAGNVYVGGSFLYAGNAVANNIARWDGVNWYALGHGSGGPVFALAVDNRNGNVYAGGVFTNNGVLTNCIAKWNGSTWTALPSPAFVNTNSGPFPLAVDDQGILYSGGLNTAASSLGVAAWDGTNWFPLGSGVNGPVNALCYDDNGHLFVSGNFATAGTNTSRFVSEAIVGTATNPPTLAISNNPGGGVTLSWPLDHTGWRLQSQSNPPGQGIISNWFTIPNSTDINATNFPINPGAGSVLYRLVYP